MWGWAARLWVAELWPLGAAFPCAGVHKALHVCISRLLQSHAPVYHRPSLAAGCLPCCSIPSPFVQIKMAPASVSFPLQNRISQTRQQTFGGEIICVHSWEVSGHHVSSPPVIPAGILPGHDCTSDLWQIIKSRNGSSWGTSREGFIWINEAWRKLLVHSGRCRQHSELPLLVEVTQ